jgi:hypothetical protein
MSPHDGITDMCPTIDTSRPCSLTYHIYLLGPHPHSLEEMHVPFHGCYCSHPCLGLCCIRACSYKLPSSTYHGNSLQSLWFPQFLLRTHNPHVLVLQVIYALTCRTFQVLIALLLHTPKAMLVVAIWAWEDR